MPPSARHAAATGNESPHRGAVGMTTTPAEPAVVTSEDGPVLPHGVRAYVLGVALLGAAVLITVCAVQLPRVDWDSPRTVPGYLLAALLFAGELRRMLVVRRDGDSDRLTVSSTFAVALVLTGPLCLALLAQCTATALDDLRQRRGALRTMFNIGQYALTLGAVHVAFMVPQRGPLLGIDAAAGVALAPAIAGAVTYFAANNLLVGIVFALVSGQSLGEVLREDLRVHGLDSAIMLGLAPIAAVTITHSLAFTPFVVLPLLGVQRNARIASQRQHESLHDDLTDSRTGRSCKCTRSGRSSEPQRATAASL